MKAWVLVMLLPLFGCSVLPKLPKVKSPEMTVTPSALGPTVTQTGDAAEPARVITTETQASIPVPPGAVITISPAPVVEGQPVIEPKPITYTVKSNDITGPRAMTPPPPPTPSQIANARGILNSYYAAGFLVLGAGFLFWRGHIKAAVIALVTAIAVPIVANFAGSDLAQKVLIGGACVTVALFSAWHFMRDKIDNAPEGEETKAGFIFKK